MSLMDRLLGRALASHEEEENKVGVAAGIPLLGLDALASSAYGPEAALTVLLPLGAMGLAYIGPVMGVILAILVILYLSYRQTIAAYPTGGGSYTVAKENLGIWPGLLAGASLLVDYVLTAAVGISAGVGALISAVPGLQPYRLLFCLGILLLITVINLRGIKESGVAFAVPTYVFILSLSAVLVLGAIRILLSGGHPTPVIAPPALPTATEVTLGGVALLWLVVRAFASGCTAMTGVEAVSNGVGAFARPAVPNAQRTLTVIVGLLGALLVGITWVCHVYGIGATEPEGTGYQSVISQMVAAIVGRGAFYYITLASTLAVLALSANTGFADFPRLCRLIAEDDFLPHAFANRGRRLVYSLGITILAVLTGLLLIAFGGVTDRLIPLFAVGAFGAFTLSQAGMVVHWQRKGQKISGSLLINALGALATLAALVVVLVAKFAEGAWVTLLLIPGLLLLFARVKGHYEYVVRTTATTEPLDVSDRQPPVVVIPVSHWSVISRNAIHFAMRLSPQVVGVHILVGHGPNVEREEQDLRREWEQCVATPARTAGLIAPELRVVASPYRRLFTPLMRQVLDLQRDNPERVIAVIIPELVESRWYQYFLHNQRATGLKAALLLRGGRRVIVINVPWYLE